MSGNNGNNNNGDEFGSVVFSRRFDGKNVVSINKSKKHSVINRLLKPPARLITMGKSKEDGINP